MLKFAARRKPAVVDQRCGRKPAAEASSGPVELSAEQLRQVSGGLPCKTWGAPTSASSLPCKTW
jgi:hypothetical protein